MQTRVQITKPGIPKFILKALFL